MTRYVSEIDFVKKEDYYDTQKDARTDNICRDS